MLIFNSTYNLLNDTAVTPAIINAPLEQFEILNLITVGGFFTFTNIHYFYILLFLFFFLLWNSFFFNKLHNHNKYNLFYVFLFIFNELSVITLRNINIKIGQRYFSLLFFIFLLLLACNLMGMIPYAFTITSHVIITFTLSFIIFFAINFIAIKDINWNFFNLFLPPGAPFLITPFLIIIEFISYIARVFSLAIRLFANMMAGHTLLKILISFSFIIIFSNIFENWPLIFVGFIIFFLVYIISFLEIAIALLQGYVFIVLLCLYIKDLYISH